MKAIVTVGSLWLAVVPMAWSAQTIDFLTPAASGGQASQTANSTRLETDNKLYQAIYDAADWSGDLLEYKVLTSGSAVSTSVSSSGSVPNSRILITSGDDTDTNGVIDQGLLLSADTMALTQAWSTASGAVSAAFPSVSASEGWKQLISYLATNEVPANASSVRDRSSKVIGDIINSAPQFSGNFDFGYQSLTTSSVSGATSSPGDLYYSFIASGGASSIRHDMIYVGANDGSLHAFDADNSLTEVFAFYPQTLWAKLPALVDANYDHQYYVDGSVKVADAFDVSEPDASNKWKTVLVGTTGAGGTGVFALDVTNPVSNAAATSAFADKTVLWEIDESITEYADLGYTLAQPSVVLLQTGQWAALVANGYGNGKSLLYVIDLFTGQKIAQLDTGVTSGGGLSTPVAIDSDGDDAADIVYAGDLLGNLWRFDISDANSSNWAVSKLYAASASQPITSKPQVMDHENGQLVLVGTGKYFESIDKDAGGLTNNFFGILDDNSGGEVLSGQLIEQSIIADNLSFSLNGQNFIVRVTSDLDVVYKLSGSVSNQVRGWRISFGLDSDGYLERIVSEPVVRNGRVIFTTLIPDGGAYSGTGWLMELDALTGARLDEVAFDLNGDGSFSSEDKVTITDSSTISVVVSGVQSKVGLISTPNVISSGDREYKYNSGSSGKIQVTTESTGSPNDSRGHGRTGWQQLQ